MSRPPAETEPREWLGALFDALDKGVCLVDVLFDDAGGVRDYVFVAVNAAFERQSGLRDVVGRGRREIEPHQDEHWFELMGRVARTGVAEHVVRDSVTMDRVFEVSATRVGLPDAHQVALVFRDVTASTRAERALAETRARLEASERRLLFALEAGRMGAWELDLTTRTLVCSDGCRANYGLPPGAPFTYDDLVDVVLEEDRPAWAADVAQAAATGADLDLEYRTRWPDGSTHWIEVRGRCARDATGAVVGMSGVSMLVDERKRVEGELRAADRRKDEFLATASHELRTPLHAILGWAQLLRGGTLDARAATRAVEVIERNARAQVQLVDDILDASRMIAGKLRLEPRGLDPAAVVRAAIDAVGPAAETKGITLRSTLDDVPRLVADPERLQQVVWNLLTNAIKFGRSGGDVHVRVAVAAGGDAIAIVVRDDGEGIDPRLLPHVFEHFRQGDQGASRRHGGLGLGLALARHLVDAHGGRIEAASDGRDRGATFTVTLPLPAGPRDAAALASGAHGAFRDGRELVGARVLVVDDQADGGELVATILEARGAEVIQADGARAALAVCAASTPDVVVSDVGMPDMDGHALVRELVARRRAAGAPAPRLLVALTAFARLEDRAAALEAGFHVHLPKPVDPATLTQAIVDGLARAP